MKSKTSSCKNAALRKDFSRFWPVWVGYTIFLGLLQIIQSNDDLHYWYAANMGSCISIMGAVNGIFALVVVQNLFGDLFNTRMCYGIHSLPLRREQWFSVHVKSGFLFSVLPTAWIVCLSEVLIHQYSGMTDGWQLPLYWWAGANIQYIFFFGLAVFCAMCAGSKTGLTILYGIANFFSLLIYLLVDQLYTPLLQGVVTMSGPFELLSPMYWIANLTFIDTERIPTGKTYIDTFGVEQREFIGKFQIASEGWQYIAVTALVGILLLLMARQMYKKRHLERSGDFLAVRWLVSPFQVVFTVMCAAAFHAVFQLFFGISRDQVYLLPAVGLTVGWFAGRILLERSTQVFRFRNFLGFAVLAALLAGSLYLTHLDPLGIETWIPGQGEVKSATLRMNYRQGHTAEDPEELEDFFRLHELALQQQLQVHPDYNDLYFSPYDQDPQAAQIILQYETPNGWLSQRNYYVLAEGESGQILRKYNSRLSALFPHENVQDAQDLYNGIRNTQIITVNGLQIDTALVTPAFLRSLAEAVAADCDAGTMIQSGAFHPEPVMEQIGNAEPLYYLDVAIHGTENYWADFTVYADCENTMEVLTATGILDAVRADREKYYG